MSKENVSDGLITKQERSIKGKENTLKNHTYLGLFIVGENCIYLNSSTDIIKLQNKKRLHSDDLDYLRKRSRYIQNILRGKGYLTDFTKTFLKNRFNQGSKRGISVIQKTR